MGTGEFGTWLAFRAEGGSVKELDHGVWGTAAVVSKARYTPEGRESVAKLLARAPDLLRERDELREALEAITAASDDAHQREHHGHDAGVGRRAVERASEVAACRDRSGPACNANRLVARRDSACLGRQSPASPAISIRPRRKAQNGGWRRSLL